ncbi:hypothetical protein Tco_0987764 [Tanacetum coccineum]
MTESPLVDSNFAVPVFSPGDDPIACLNKVMAFLGSPQPIINLALPRIQETKLLFKMQTSQGLLYATTVKRDDIWLGKHTQARNKECRWYKEKSNVSYSSGSWKILDEGPTLAFLADPGVPEWSGYSDQSFHTTLLHFQTEADLDT